MCIERRKGQIKTIVNKERTRPSMMPGKEEIGDCEEIFRISWNLTLINAIEKGDFSNSFFSLLFQYFLLLFSPLKLILVSMKNVFNCFVSNEGEIKKQLEEMIKTQRRM